MEKQSSARAHLRMDVMILLQHRRLTTKEYEEMEKTNFDDDEEGLSIQSFSLQPFIEDKEKEEEIGNVEPFIINALIDINLKLNLIFTMLSCSKGEPSIFTQKPVEVNLSEGGIGFIIKGKVKKGDILELKILLPVFPLVLIKAWGKVIRSTPMPKDGCKVGVQYLNVKEEDRDKIVHYIFKKQRELLRSKKA